MLVKALKKFFGENPNDSGIVEGLMAHEYQEEDIRKSISARYYDYHAKIKTPWTDPLEFDPLNPPPGWAWDPFYSVWVKY